VLNMVFAKDNLSTNAMGGTELMKNQLQKYIDARLFDEFQIFNSRVQEELDETKLRIYWIHDLPGDPAVEHLANGGWNNFHKIVFVSNWQMQAFISRYQIPWNRCIVLHNAINPIESHEKPTDGPVRLAYWSTPHRGLSILAPVFDKLSEKYDVELDVYSSFKIYGWAERDKEFEELFDFCKKHPKINYYGSIPNATLRGQLKNTHILAYPNIWPETSCITLMEAMSAGILAVHPNFAALSETAANWTYMYQWTDNMNEHAGLFYNVLESAVQNINDPNLKLHLQAQKSYADGFYNWQSRAHQWKSLLTSLLNEPRELEKPNQFFQYKVG
jgi:UDP-glucose:(glucosyl)LPS alpha-1,2-glucosyltransferase